MAPIPQQTAHIKILNRIFFKSNSKKKMRWKNTKDWVGYSGTELVESYFKDKDSFVLLTECTVMAV